jgi:hypothetical protein
MKLSKEDLVERALLIKETEEAPLVHRETEIDLNEVRTGKRNGKGSRRI